MRLEVLPGSFAVCRLAHPADAPSYRDGVGPVFLAVTPEEVSLVCPSQAVPAGALAVEDGWSVMRVAGPLDFGLVGILARLSGTLARAGIPVFVVSTYLTDYVLVKADRLADASAALAADGITVGEG